MIKADEGARSGHAEASCSLKSASGSQTGQKDVPNVPRHCLLLWWQVLWECVLATMEHSAAWRVHLATTYKKGMYDLPLTQLAVVTRCCGCAFRSYKEFLQPEDARLAGIRNKGKYMPAARQGSTPTAG